MICWNKYFWKFITCTGWYNIWFLWTNFRKGIFLFRKLMLMIRSRSWGNVIPRACECSVIKVIMESFLASSMSIDRIRFFFAEVEFSHYFKLFTIKKSLLICHLLCFVLIILLVICYTCKEIRDVLHAFHFFELVSL